VVRSRVQKWGNSLAFRIPKAIAIEAGLQLDSPIDVSISGGRIIVEAVPAPTYDLDEMLARVTHEDLHPEVDTGPPAGTEAW
jgi:antitoxin MazE